MIHRSDLDSILSLLERQQAALASNADDAVDRLERVNEELQRALARLQPLNMRKPTPLANRDDVRKATKIAQQLIDNRVLMMRRNDHNRRALQVLLRTEPLVYTR